MTPSRNTAQRSNVDLTDATRQKLVGLLDGRLDRAVPAERACILMEVTLLFLRTAEDASPATLTLFDAIFPRLIDGLETEMLVALATALAPIDTTPVRTAAALARHQDAAVAAPILARAKSLLLTDLVAVARTGSEAHLVAIASRARVEERLAALLIARSFQPVIDRLLANPGARMTAEDFRIALPRATADTRGRVAFRQPAAILDEAGTFAGRCVTLDISPGGVKLQVDRDAQVADKLTIELSAIGQLRLHCRMAWRQAATAGLQFTTPLAEQLTAGRPALARL